MAMRVDFFGPQTDFIDGGFFDPNTGEFDPDVISATSTQLVLMNPETGWVVVLTGSGLPTDPEDGALTGTITGISFYYDGTEQARISGMSWGLEAFANALDEDANGNFAPFAALLNQQEIIYDSSAASVGNRDMYLDEVTRDNTLIGSDFDDEMMGGDGDDTLLPGANDGDDVIYGSGGDDTIDFAGAANFSAYTLDYSDFSSISAVINALANTGTITKTGVGTDTLLNVALTQDYNGGTGDGLGLVGGSGGDSFSVTTMSGSWLSLNGRGGSDSYNIVFGASDSTVRLTFSSNSAFTGAVVDLGAQTIANDGFGNSETLSISGAAGRIEVQGTNHDDSLTGSDSRDSFRGMGGDDTIDGGAGFDRVRYDRGEISDLHVDLAAGTATGLWNGSDFEDQLISIEQVRGSAGNDLIEGDGAANALEGRDGGDVLRGRAGDDTLDGGNGDDLLSGGADIDRLYGGEGNDTLTGETGKDFLYGGSGDDFLFGGYANDKLFGEGGDDLLSGDGNDDTLDGGLGSDTLLGGDGTDLLRGGAGFGWDLLEGGNGNDRLIGGGGKDTLIGGAGNDKLNGGGAADLFIFADGFGNDTLTNFDSLDAEKIDLSGVTEITSFADLMANHLVNVGGTAQITVGSDSILLAGVAFGSVGVGLAYSADDFIF